MKSKYYPKPMSNNNGSTLAAVIIFSIIILSISGFVMNRVTSSYAPQKKIIASLEVKFLADRMIEEAMKAVLDDDFIDGSTTPTGWVFNPKDGSYYFSIKDEASGLYLRNAVVILSAPKIGYEFPTLSNNVPNDVQSEVDFADEMDASPTTTYSDGSIAGNIVIDVFAKVSEVTTSTASLLGGDITPKPAEESLNYTVVIEPNSFFVDGVIFTEALYIEGSNIGDNDYYQRLTGIYDSEVDRNIKMRYESSLMRRFNKFNSIQRVKDLIDPEESNYMSSFRDSFNIFGNGYGSLSPFNSSERESVTVDRYFASTGNNKPKLFLAEKEQVKEFLGDEIGRFSEDHANDILENAETLSSAPFSYTLPDRQPGALYLPFNDLDTSGSVEQGLTSGAIAVEGSFNRVDFPQNYSEIAYNISLDTGGFSGSNSEFPDEENGKNRRNYIWNGKSGETNGFDNFQEINYSDMWRNAKIDPDAAGYAWFEGSTIDYKNKSNSNAERNILYPDIRAEGNIYMKLDGVNVGGSVQQLAYYDIGGRISTSPLGAGKSRLIIHIPAGISEVNFYSDVLSGKGRSDEIIIIADYDPNMGRGAEIRFKNLDSDGNETFYTNDMSKMSTVQAIIYAPHSTVFTQNFVGSIVARKLHTNGIVLIDQTAQQFMLSEIAGVSNSFTQTDGDDEEDNSDQDLYVASSFKRNIPSQL